MGLHRIDPADTIDCAIRHLVGLQADGWQLHTLTTTFDYQPPAHNMHALPVAATITVVLHPTR